jgi:RND family efflux transporter MFP subunit
MDANLITTMKQFFLAGVGLLFVFLTGSGCKKASVTEQPPLPVNVVTVVEKEVNEWDEFTGRLEAVESVEIRARVSGHLIKRDYIEGALVKEGDLLFEIDPRPFAAALAKAKGNLENARATQTKTDADEKRAIQLFTEKVMSPMERDAALQAAAGQRANVSALEAAVSEAELNLGYTKITAPVAGIAGMANASVGDLVGNDVVLTTISRLDPAQISFPVSEADYFAAKDRALELLKMPIEQRPEEIELILADGSSFPQKARLDAVDRQAQTATGTILVNALVKNPGGVLRPGFFARARVVAQVMKEAIEGPLTGRKLGG